MSTIGRILPPNHPVPPLSGGGACESGGSSLAQSQGLVMGLALVRFSAREPHPFVRDGGVCSCGGQVSGTRAAGVRNETDAFGASGEKEREGGKNRGQHRRSEPRGGSRLEMCCLHAPFAGLRQKQQTATFCDQMRRIPEDLKDWESPDRSTKSQRRQVFVSVASYPSHLVASG